MNEEALFEKALGNTNLGIGCVGVGTLALGGFMIALHAAGLDPDTRHMTVGALIALYFFAILFVVVGLLMLYVGAIKGPAQNKRLREIVKTSPNHIARVYGKVIKTQGAENLPGGQHCVCIHLDDGTYHQLLVGANDMDPLLDYLRRRAPSAIPTPP